MVNPPAPRRLPAVVALAVLLLCVAAVSAETITISIDEDIVDSKNYELGSPGSGSVSPSTIRVYDAQNYPVGSRSTLIWYGPIASNNQTMHANQIPINLRLNSVSGTVVGEGTMGYYRDSTGLGYVYVDFEWFVPLSGSQRIFLENSGQYAWRSLQNIELEGGGTVAGGLSNDAPMGFGDSLTGDVITRSKVGTYTANNYIPFRHIIVVEEVSEISDRISIYRNIEGVAYQSSASISGASGQYVQSTDVTNITQIIGNDDRPYTVAIDNLHGQWYNRTFFAESLPGPGDAALVTVYVRNSQTGALLADSHIVISASVDGEFHEVVNQTLPGGIYNGPLQPTGGGLPNPDYYRLTATADGYNPYMPYIDFELDRPTTLIVEMEPTGGGPEDENKTFIEFYVRDLNTNPISGATVTCGGYSLLTNSAGFTQFELPVNASYPYKVSKSNYITIEGTATVADDPRYTVNVVLGQGEIPTLTPTPTAPGATPTPDRRTNEEKGQAVIDMIADNAEGIGALALICLIMGLLKLLAKW